MTDQHLSDIEISGGEMLMNWFDKNCRFLNSFRIDHIFKCQIVGKLE